MNLRHSEAARCLAFEVEFDQDRRPRANDPCIMPGFDLNYLGSCKTQGATVTVANADLTAREEANVRVHAKIRTDYGLHVNRPTKAGGINKTLYPARSGFDNIEFHSSNFATIGTRNRGEERINGTHI